MWVIWLSKEKVCNFTPTCLVSEQNKASKKDFTVNKYFEVGDFSAEQDVKNSSMKSVHSVEDKKLHTRQNQNKIAGLQQPTGL